MSDEAVQNSLPYYKDCGTSIHVSSALFAFQRASHPCRLKELPSPENLLQKRCLRHPVFSATRYCCAVATHLCVASTSLWPGRRPNDLQGNLTTTCKRILDHYNPIQYKSKGFKLLYYKPSRISLITLSYGTFAGDFTEVWQLRYCLIELRSPVQFVGRNQAHRCA